jgi:pimeloyl-ACP methyl ester carboxylesterase
MASQDRTVQARGLSFHCVEWGAAAAAPLICLHGITQTAHSWDEVAAELGRDYRVLCFDQRGHGDSDWAPEGDYSRQTQAADLEAISAALGLEEFVLMGMSMGGINSITFTARRPQAVRALIIVDVSPEIQAKGVENIRNFIQQQDVLPSFEAFVERAHAFNPRRSIENIRSRLQHNLKQLDDGRWTWKYDPALRSPNRGFQASALTNLWDDVRLIRCPTLIIKGGESDILSAESAAKLQAAIPGSQLAIIPGAGHSVMGDNPEAFAEAVFGFLRKMPASPHQ